MQTRKLGNSDMPITPVGFGAWAIGGAGYDFGWGPQEDDESIALGVVLDSLLNWPRRLHPRLPGERHQRPHPHHHSHDVEGDQPAHRTPEQKNIDAEVGIENSQQRDMNNVDVDVAWRVLGQLLRPA